MSNGESENLFRHPFLVLEAVENTAVIRAYLIEFTSTQK